MHIIDVFTQPDEHFVGVIDVDNGISSKYDANDFPGGIAVDLQTGPNCCFSFSTNLAPIGLDDIVASIEVSIATA